MIDGGIFLGRNPTNGNSLTESEIITFLDRYSISKALVASYKSIFFDYKEGNKEVLYFHKRYPGRMIPVAFIQPNGFDSFKDTHYLSDLQKAGVRVLGIYLAPKYYDIQLESLLVRNIAERASQAGMVLQFGLESPRDFYKVVDYYSHFSTPVLIRWMGGRGYNSLAEILNVVTRHQNFYFDIGSLTCSGGIKHLADSIGTNRLYFASNIPESFKLSSHFLVQTAGLNANQLKQIYSGTLSEVFSLRKDNEDWDTRLKVWSQSFDSILKKPKIDTHWHTDGWNIIEPEKDYAHFRHEFERFNYQKVIISSIHALNYDMKRGNEEVFKLLAKDKRLYGLVVVDPTRVDGSVAEIEKYAGNENCVGIKTIQDLYGLGLDHESYRPILEKAGEKRLTVMAHIPGMKETSRRFPNLTFVCGHSTYERVKHLFDCPNVHFDIATSHNDASGTKMEEFIARVGEDRILFSSDGPLVSPAWTLGKLASCRISSNVLDKVLIANAQRAFPKLSGAEKAVKARSVKKDGNVLRKVVSHG